MFHDIKLTKHKKKTVMQKMKDKKAKRYVENKEQNDRSPSLSVIPLYVNRLNCLMEDDWQNE